MEPNTTRDSAVVAGNGSWDLSRVSAELSRLEVEQTAPIALLPTEILFHIIEILSHDGVKKPDVQNFLSSCVDIYRAGLPLSFRKVWLNEGKGVEQLRALEAGRPVSTGPRFSGSCAFLNISGGRERTTSKSCKVSALCPAPYPQGARY